jgi:lipopolysaccharide export system permease protein
MRILDGYIRRTVWQYTFNVMAVLVAVFTFFRFIEELNQLGKGNYGVLQALQFVALSMPELAYDLCPIGALLGSLLGLGAMLSNSELTIIRASGVPVWRIVYAVVKAGLVIALVAVLIGEFVVPPSEQLAHARRSVAINEQILLKARNGFWVRDGSSFVNIRKLQPGNKIEDVYIYEFGANQHLRASSHAKRANYHDGAWELEEVEQTIFRSERTVRRIVARAKWESKLDAALVHDVVIKPYSLSVHDLARFSEFLEKNGQSSLQYRQALWYKLFYPLAAGAMVFLAVPIVLTTASRSIALGQRIVVGASIGLTFHLINKTTGYVGYIFDLSPITSVMLPTLLTLTIGVVLMRRVH